MSTDDEVLTKLTVFLTPAAHADLEEAAEALGDTGTDTVNRALRLYAAIVETALTAGGSGEVRFELTEKDRVRLIVTRIPRP